MVCARHPSFGPIGYGGLPGLILELQNESTTLCHQDKFKPDSPPEIDKLLSPKAISKEVVRQLTTGTLSRAQLDVPDEEDKQIKNIELSALSNHRNCFKP
jgi:hypothetical protein